MTSDPRPLWSTLLDMAVYAPIGAVLHGPEAVEDLASKGRQDVRNARVIGQITLDKGRREADRIAADVGSRVGDLLAAAARAAGAPLVTEDPDLSGDPGSSADESSGSSPSDPTAPDDAAMAPVSVVAEPEPSAVDEGVAAAGGVPPEPQAAPEAESLAIPDYDNLAASQVVPRLDDLAEAELVAVEAYERAHRGRMTVLSRIAQLRTG